MRHSINVHTAIIILFGGFKFFHAIPQFSGKLLLSFLIMHGVTAHHCRAPSGPTGKNVILCM